MATFNFNANSVEPMQPRTYGPLPAGDYEMIIVKSDVKPTKAGTGHYLELEMQVIAGESSGRRHWERLNVDNPNKQAEEIAKEALAALCFAVGVTDMEDTVQLHDIPFVAHVEIDRKEPDRNRITGYATTKSSAPAPVARPAAPAPAAAAPARKPWEK
ncbi:Protein of unknown function DUF669 [uncultured Caudovirales phage]|uniref:DUF669 domain-containing protein n=1 Tax=uncultured Caudovirales phage TaxID=2100421 RepID=A0A6J5LTZ4_9CAUD|nr:Protein of unknown function DUF669 [uncultured Caudovirales phage]